MKICVILGVTKENQVFLFCFTKTASFNNANFRSITRSTTSACNSTFILIKAELPSSDTVTEKDIFLFHFLFLSLHLVFGFQFREEKKMHREITPTHHSRLQLQDNRTPFFLPLINALQTELDERLPCVHPHETYD